MPGLYNVAKMKALNGFMAEAEKKGYLKSFLNPLNNFLGPILLATIQET
jgi:hypothetical protein